MNDCLSNHEKCAPHSQRDTFCPTRLLDMASFDGSDDVRLVQDLNNVEWVALSHCWGPGSLRPITTTNTTLSERSARVPFASLSQTFQDAAKTTRALGFRYLWIDSLCIIQDNKPDWEREANTMSRVYGCSALTLCAMSSQNSTQGCRVNAMGTSRPGNISRYADFPIGDMRIRFFERSPTYWHKECGDDPYKFEGFNRASRNPLNTRAWTLQERELSPRKVHFSQNMLLWECGTIKASSELPWLERIYDEDTMPDPILLPGESGLAPNGPARQRDKWYSLLEDYSSRFMTKEDDKLVAMRGLIDRYRELCPTMEEVAGIWKEHLPASLLWQSWPYDNSTEGQVAARGSFFGAFYPRRPMTKRAPSWSWASIDGLISYQSQRIKADLGICVAEFLAHVVSYLPGTSEVASEASEGAVITVIGRLTCARFGFEPIRSGTEKAAAAADWTEHLRPLKSEAGNIIGAFFPDIITEVQFLDHIYCLAIQKEVYSSVLEEPGFLHGDQAMNEEDFKSRGLIMGLALVKHGLDIYRRIGLIRWVKPTLFDEIDDRVATLV